ncbi:hypothetical protein FWD20_00495 [Candidatus Saccharibacteria bacterium]|nr:hypothetical protein [Candidatus Saccharibacteria bacterium]
MRYHPLHHHKPDSSRDNRRLLIGDVLGWIGALSLVSAYILVSSDVVSAQSYLYQTLNIIGGSGLLVLALIRKAYPSAATNTMWVVVGVIAIVALSH